MNRSRLDLSCMNDDLPGTVYLIGSGPGDPDLLTVKAQRLIRQCGAIVYDSLVPNEVLELVQPSCELIFVGKRRNQHSVPQNKTNTILLELVQRYDCVVRLKGGDPFVFGRGGEEAHFLKTLGISVEVVPGLTSGIAASAYMGIPLTHRSAASAVTFVTGHEGNNKEHQSVDWKGLANASDTLVIYMGIYNLDYIVKELLSSKLSSSTPVAVIQQATVRGQRYLKSNLSLIISEVEKRKFESPSIIIVGSVINYQVEECAPEPSHVTMPISFS